VVHVAALFDPLADPDIDDFLKHAGPFEVFYNKLHLREHLEARQRGTLSAQERELFRVHAQEALGLLEEPHALLFLNNLLGLRYPGQLRLLLEGMIKMFEHTLGLSDADVFRAPERLVQELFSARTPVEELGPFTMRETREVNMLDDAKAYLRRVLGATVVAQMPGALGLPGQSSQSAWPEQWLQDMSAIIVRPEQRARNDLVARVNLEAGRAVRADFIYRDVGSGETSFEPFASNVWSERLTLTIHGAGYTHSSLAHSQSSKRGTLGLESAIARYLISNDLAGDPQNSSTQGFGSRVMRTFAVTALPLFELRTVNDNSEIIEYYHPLGMAFSVHPQRVDGRMELFLGFVTTSHADVREQAAMLAEDASAELGLLHRGRVLLLDEWTRYVCYETGRGMGWSVAVDYNKRALTASNLMVPGLADFEADVGNILLQEPILFQGTLEALREDKTDIYESYINILSDWIKRLIETETTRHSKATCLADFDRGLLAGARGMSFTRYPRLALTELGVETP